MSSLLKSDLIILRELRERLNSDLRRELDCHLPWWTPTENNLAKFFYNSVKDIIYPNEEINWKIYEKTLQKYHSLLECDPPDRIKRCIAKFIDIFKDVVPDTKILEFQMKGII